jgi:hypothetical protein
MLQRDSVDSLHQHRHKVTSSGSFDYAPIHLLNFQSTRRFTQDDIGRERREKATGSQNDKVKVLSLRV